MNKSITNIVIVGGGTAGWITAGLLAIEAKKIPSGGIKITVVESPDLPPIGVGEGTWPTMRRTLAKIGLPENEFIKTCNVSFKQGTKFIGWKTGGKNDQFYHPFSLPAGYPSANLYEVWSSIENPIPYAFYSGTQPHACESNLAPKHIQTPEYNGMLNYGYHLEASAFSKLLASHCLEKLNVEHKKANVKSVSYTSNGYIDKIKTQECGDISGDLFIDCTGMSRLLIKRFDDVKFHNQQKFLFADSAVVTQMPYENEMSSIASQTNSTAQEAGWIWDIGLQSRRGIGHVYSSSHITLEKAEESLLEYCEKNGGNASDCSFRSLKFEPGYLNKFWSKNCIAIGLSSGFVEPLEASSLVMVEIAAGMVSRRLGHLGDAMDEIAGQFNRDLSKKWERIIEFLKLHYCLSERSDSAFWRENRNSDTIPARLQEMLAIWRYFAPSRMDFDSASEIFPSASYLYVLSGMGRKLEGELVVGPTAKIQTLQAETVDIAMQFRRVLPTNRALLEQILR